MDIQALMQALSPEQPAGEDMSFSSEFDTIAEMRRHDDPSLSQGEWVTELKTADWSGVAKLTEQLLLQRSRDLRLAAWWAEAQAHLQGYAGLAEGIGLVATLCDSQWAHLHPQPDEGDMELRIGSLSWLLAQVTALARALPVLKLGNRPLSLVDMEAARMLQQALDRAAEGGPAVSTEGKVTQDMVSRAQRDTPSHQLIATRDALRQLKEELLRLQTVVDRHLGLEGPGFTAAKESVEQALHGLERMVRDTGAEGGVALPASEAVESGSAAPHSLAGATAATPNGPLATRAQALAQLRQVAEFFRRTEPHSPVAYLADKAAKWGDMPLHAWLRAVMKDQGSLSQLEDLLGVEPPQDQHQQHY